LTSAAKTKWLLRIGRQEFAYGSQRLIAVRDGPNNRQSFDALKGIFTAGNYKADLFFSHYVKAKKQLFDDGFNKDSKFWGAYLVRNKIPFLHNIDLYYLGLWKRKAVFDDGVAKEVRHSIGNRIWNNTGRVKYDMEAVYQFGKFAKKNISAWTLSFNTAYKLSQTGLKPEIGLKTEWISGDAAYDDNKLQSFNPLFPRGGYFGLASLIGPANLFDIHPSLTLELTRKLFVDIDYDIFWRYSVNDGIYTPGVALIYSGKNNSYKNIGRQLTTDLVYMPNNFLYFRGEFTWFDAGSFLRAAGSGKDILFTGITAQIKF
jgi:Alginate export